MSKVAETDAVMAEVNKVTKEYLPLAQACSDAFFILTRLGQVDRTTYSQGLDSRIVLEDATLRCVQGIHGGNGRCHGRGQQGHEGVPSPRAGLQRRVLHSRRERKRSSRTVCKRFWGSVVPFRFGLSRRTWSKASSSDAFFILDEMHSLNHFYQFSLRYFLDAFDHVLLDPC
jgi:hypothetical protein